MSKADSSSEDVINSVALEAGLVDSEKPADADIVDWEGPDDPTNPINWPSRKRWAHAITVSVLALIT